MKENTNIDLNGRSFTDQGSKESLNWLPIESLNKIYIMPEFFKTKLLRSIDGIEHIVTKE